ncbi:ATP-dependent RecD-like DNA helicase [Lactonifactor longoviformis]|uniref:ATP-dependent RecD2 DNA helicase n=1 Tax=Lactonifactor longoviformis DSM 17459 TaxID=1122155 RepID=A0A1M5AQP9_9CLOT|nr:ATP-dependent RecD-like DNA helicase [Lactonifactor longoviformis]POP32626.1 ATP-dependent RecD-like DNA helicase [Lactonifactor longoviformis]SHF32581.1 exodeoxyribonuclease V alpha subunit [Lactonifactor longoviformis DSM 17459]
MSVEETIEGYIDHVIFRNEENGYTVMCLVSGGEEVTCVGNFQYIGEGETIKAEGRFTEHPSYGAQFTITSFETVIPQDAAAMERYLGSGAIKGIGAALAARIVRRFGDDTLRIAEEEPERLAEIKGISVRKAREIAEQMEEKADMRKAMIFLQQYGISLSLGVKIYQQYGPQLYGVLKENPYRMAEDISGVGFKMADEIAARIGIHTDSDYRIRSGLLYILLQGTFDGHTYLPKEVLLRRTSQLLGVEAEYMEKHVMDLAVDRKVVVKEIADEKSEVLLPVVYASQFYHLELHTAQMLRELNIKEDVDETLLEKQLRRIEANHDVLLDERQREAVKEAVRWGVLVITGGPGTGKTTTINAIIRYFEGEGQDIFLAAPTGRAAKRMTEATGYEARTIHRLLELTGVPEDSSVGAHFERNEENPLDADVIIIDEMSMVDIHLMHALLSAVTVGTRLVLVGDVNQLPSVGPGSVLKDIIASGNFHVVELTKIFRQATQSDIVVNAHKINRGERVLLDNKSMDFFFLKRYDANVIISVIITLIQKKLPKFVDAEPLDIQVLSPMRKGLLGVERLNQILQQYLNPPAPEKKEREQGQGLFREGDKVMQIKNNYQLPWEIRGRYGIAAERGEGVFNGDMGIVKEINSFGETLTVEYDECRYVEYAFSQLDELELAYAVTIHKSQGSEYPAVIIPLLGGPKMLMTRNLLYTAVTRARKCVTLVGDERTFEEMIENEMEQSRYTTLDLRIQEAERGGW